MPRRKSLEELRKEEERLKELIAKKRQRLYSIKRKIREEKRKREARFLIAIGRALLKYGQRAKIKDETVIVLPIKNQAFKTAFKDYLDIIKDNKDFAKWLKVLEITGEGEERERGEEKGEKKEGKEDNGQGD